MTEDTNENGMNVLENISTSEVDDVPKSVPAVIKKHVSKEKKLTPSTEIIRGKPKSGRFWKTTKEKFATINKTKGLKLDFEKKTALRLELQRTKELSRQVQEEIKQRELQRKERRKENIKRSEENKRKAEVVQVITNTAKLKRLRKKQLRFIEKRDTTQVVPTK